VAIYVVMAVAVVMTVVFSVGQDLPRAAARG